MSALSRRFLVTSAVALPALAVPAIAVATPLPSFSTQEDPTFSAIKAHQAVFAASTKANEKFSDAEGAVDERKPSTLVEWRGYSFCADNIERGLEWHLEQPNADRTSIEREFAEIKTRARNVLRSDQEWYERHGLTGLRAENDQRRAAEQAALETLAEMNPTTIAGAAALIEYALRDMAIGDHKWQIAAIGNSAKALTALRVQS